VLDPKTGKVAIDAKTGKPIVMRRGKDKDGKHNEGDLTRRRGGAGGDSDSDGSTYEIDWSRGKYVKDPVTGEYLKDKETGRRVKVKKVGGR
jgi:hypothetical protein